MTEKLYPNATELLKSLEKKGLVIAAPIDVDKIAEMLGISVINDDSLEARNSIGEISFSDDKSVVRINPLQNSYKPRRRFTLAHEIGHYCLHSHRSREGFKDSIKTMSRRETYWDSCESEANGFAAQLLMPKELIINAGKNILSSYDLMYEEGGMPTNVFIEKMSSRFEVSNKAMEYRLRRLKIIS